GIRAFHVTGVQTCALPISSQVLAHVLERELFRSLRQEGGLSYTVVADYEPRDLTHAHLIALADALPEKQGAVLGGFIDVLAKLRSEERRVGEECGCRGAWE